MSEPTTAVEVQAETPPDTRPPITGPKTPIQIAEQGIRITNTEEAMRFAVILIKSGLAPRGIDTPEKAFVALQLGAELGLTPMNAIQNIAVINGRPSLWGDAMLGIVQASGLCESFGEEEIGERGTDAHGYVCTAKRKNNEKPFKAVFTVADAKRAGLWGKAGPWQQYPQRMLQMRARSFCLRDAFPDKLKGLLTREESQDIPREPVNVTPQRLDELDALKP